MAGRLALILLGFIISLLYSSAFNSSVLMKDYPTPFTKNNRVLGCLLAFNFQHIDPIIVTLNEYTSMCEAGWDPTMVFFTAVEWSDALIRYLKQKSYCYRLGRSINIVISQHSPSLGTGLSGEHRAYMAKVLNEYDVFVYHEDDIMFKLSHLVAYLHETKLFHELVPENGLWEHTIGFQRYRRINRGNDFNMPYGERDIFEQELLEETPEFVPVCVKDKPYIHVQGNIHQAMWVFTRQQVIMLQERCSFLNQSSASREYMSSFSLFDRKTYHCGLTKLLPSERLYTFAVLHYYQQRHVSWTPVIMADENVRAGFHSRAVPRSPISMPACWDSIVKRSRKEQNITSSR